ncbi:hypothetical protein CVT25_000108 [Psilocybe cyanescens]|uniref:Uncharacterized protein n=1 Tax=Psilocybe cyanescens TaxID=93625 RepID=A0A409XQF0_PSICY|nr:hypothetical protein CVT25_000108 [Psilocybe cyanescens]
MPEAKTYANPYPTHASLISSCIAANTVYSPPALQAQLNLQSGILHAEEKDYHTMYLYLFEAFENLSMLGESEGGGEWQ